MTTATRRPYRTKISDGPRVSDGDTLRCRECGESMPVDSFRLLASGSRASYCSPCQNGMTRRWRETHRADLNAKRRAEYPRQELTDRSCGTCGETFTPATHNARYCGPMCKRAMKLRHMSPRRRAAHVAAMKLRPQVIELYGSVCYLCGDDIPGGRHYLQPDALTIDHVIPVARGGSDDIENLRPAHRACNIRKGAPT